MNSIVLIILFTTVFNIYNVDTLPMFISKIRSRCCSFLTRKIYPNYSNLNSLKGDDSYGWEYKRLPSDFIVRSNSCSIEYN